MTEKAKEARRNYYKRWRSENRENVREYNRAYWERRAAHGGAGN